MPSCVYSPTHYTDLVRNLHIYPAALVRHYNNTALAPYPRHQTPTPPPITGARPAL